MTRSESVSATDPKQASLEQFDLGSRLLGEHRSLSWKERTSRSHGVVPPSCSGFGRSKDREGANCRVQHVSSLGVTRSKVRCFEKSHYH